MNNLTIIGNLTADPEQRTTSSGKDVCNFSVAVNRRGQKDQNGKDIADFFRVSAWGKLCDTCMKFLHKGKKVAVRGSVSVHPYLADNGEARASLEVMADDVEFLSSASDATATTADAPAHTEQTGGFTAVETDELPF